MIRWLRRLGGSRPAWKSTKWKRDTLAQEVSNVVLPTARRLRDIEFLEQVWAFILNWWWVYLAVGIVPAVLIGARGKRRDPDEDKPPHIYW